MSIKIGGIDVAQSALDSEYRIIVLETILEAVLNRLGSNVVTQQDLEKIRNEAFQKLQRKYPNAELERTDKTLIFIDRTFSTGWTLKYWAERLPGVINEFDGEKLIFRATTDQLKNSLNENQFGAFYDLRKGINSGSKYKISCLVSSVDKTTMKFKLWIHDTLGRNPHVSKTEPEQPVTPPTQRTEYSLDYVANGSNAIRIHLHCYGGTGQINVHQVSVHKVD